MPDLTKRGFKKPLENEAYDIKVTNFNTDLIETELDKLILKDGNGKDVTVAFIEAEQDAELISNSKLSTLFGLVKKKLGLINHNKQDKAAESLQTTSKEIVGAINEHEKDIADISQQLEQKADKPIIIGGSNNTRLIGEIQNYNIDNHFNIEAMLHNMYLKNGSNLANAFLTIGKYRNDFAIEGKMHMLTDCVTNPSGNYKVSIKVTDTGKIYSVNETYMNSCTWNIIKKTNNVVIFNDPIGVSAIEGNVIWDSELNKTNIITSQQMEQITDKGYVTRIAKSTLDECNKNGKYTVPIASDANFVPGTYCVDVTAYSTNIYVQRIYMINPAINAYIRVVNGSDVALGKVATTDKIDITSLIVNGWLVDGDAVILKNGNLGTLLLSIRQGTNTNGTVLLQLPAGWRPKQTTYRTIVGSDLTTHSPIIVDVYSDGFIKLFRTVTSATRLYIDISFEIGG